MGKRKVLRPSPRPAIAGWVVVIREKRRWVTGGTYRGKGFAEAKAYWYRTVRHPEARVVPVRVGK